MKHVEPSAEKQKTLQIIMIIVISMVLLAVACSLLFRGKSVAANVKKLFDMRPDLTEIAMFETLTTQEIETIEIVVRSETYSLYTEEKTITDATEIAAFVEAIKAAKQIELHGDEKAEQVELRFDEPAFAEEADCYTFYLQDETITVFTKPNDGTFVLVGDIWQQIDFVDTSSFYECYQASATPAVIIDENNLVFYPQTWVPGATEQIAPSYGIDVSYHQGDIDWAQVAQDGVDFAIIRLGVRYAQSGILAEDPYARYNLQEATKYGIAVGAYIFSTAITQDEILEEVALTLDMLSGYPVTYPVVYNSEMFQDETNRNSVLTAAQRSAFADLYLSKIEEAGYTGMFYASKFELEKNNEWETNTLQSKYHMWVAQYPGNENGATPQGTSSYSGRHEMWQYTCQAQVAGIRTGVDRNIAYFSYSSIAEPKGEAAPPALPDYDALAKMQEVNEPVTAKEVVNVRSTMDSTSDNNLMGQLTNGQVAIRIAVGANGWSKIEFGGGVGYVVTDLITTDLTPKQQPTSNAQAFETEFASVKEIVTAKEVTNLRNMPSVTHPDSVVMASLKNGETAVRTGISSEGFSQVEYQGQTLYCVSSYLIVVG